MNYTVFIILFTKHFKHQMQLYNKQLLNKWFEKYFIVNSDTLFTAVQLTINQNCNAM